MNLPLLLPIVLGFGAIYLLLPRPSRFPATVGGILGLGALLTLGLFIGNELPSDPRQSVGSVLFYAFAALAVLFAGLTLTQNNPARAALAFAVVILSTCGLFLLLAAPFLMAATIIIYAGAIIVTFLFVIMLSQPEGYSDENDRSREPFLGSLVGFFLLGILLVVVHRVYGLDALDALIARTTRLAEADDFNTLRLELDDRTAAEAFFTSWENRLGRELVPSPRGDAYRKLAMQIEDRVQNAVDNGLEAYQRKDMRGLRTAFGQLANQGQRLQRLRAHPEFVQQGMTLSGHGRVLPVDKERFDPLAGDAQPRLPDQNVEALGRTLFTDHLIAIELGGTLLLIATIGAIVIAGARPRRSA